MSDKDMGMRKAEGKKPEAKKDAKASAAKAKAGKDEGRWDWDLLAQYP